MPVGAILFAATYGWQALRGEKPYYVPAGASSTIGHGYVNAAFEIKNQGGAGRDAPNPTTS